MIYGKPLNKTMMLVFRAQNGYFSTLKYRFQNESRPNISFDVIFGVNDRYIAYITLLYQRMTKWIKFYTLNLLHVNCFQNHLIILGHLLFCCILHSINHMIIICLSLCAEKNARKNFFYWLICFMRDYWFEYSFFVFMLNWSYLSATS